MTYQVLARKWRPNEFGALIGQQPIVTALTNALRDGRIAQAYLFSGIRGVGKTTAARLLARALNCDQGPTATPCGTCAPCREIAAGNDLDVLEIDAATHSKVEQIRELTESLRYGAARDRYKVVILDEVHRLSRQAFDALLKIVEEPPPHLVFVFATTEIEAVPATVLSRCQEFRFRRVTAPIVAQHLREICDAEGISASPAALHLIAQAGEGSVRDSVALLDQLATFGSQEVEDAMVQRLLGAGDPAFFHDLLAAVLAGRTADVSALVRRVEAEGWDPRQLHLRFLSVCRSALHLALEPDGDASDLLSEDRIALLELVRASTPPDLLRLLDHLVRSEATIRRSELATLAVEIAWMKAAELPRLVRIESLLADPELTIPTVTPTARPAPSERAPVRPQPAPPRPAAPAPPRKSAPPPSAAATAGEDGAATAEPAAGDREPSPEEESPPAARAPVGPGEDRLPDLLAALSRRRQPLAAHLASAQELAYRDGRLEIVAPDGDRWLLDALARPGNRTVLEETVREIWGESASWAIRRIEAPPVTAPTPSEPPADDPTTDPTVQAVLDIFGGEVAAVTERRADEPEGGETR